MDKIEYDFKSDPYGKMCLEQAKGSKATLGFGAILVRDGKVVGKGRNRQAEKEDRGIIPHVDYAIHAEQDAILKAIKNKRGVRGGIVYVLGQVLQGKNKGTLTTRSKRGFGCRKCPHAFIKYNISVAIPMKTGWEILNPHEAMETGKLFHGNGNWAKLVKGEISL